MIYPRGLLYSFIRRVPALPFLAECAASNLVLQARWRLEKRYGRGMMLSSGSPRQQATSDRRSPRRNAKISLTWSSTVCTHANTRTRASPAIMCSCNLGVHIQYVWVLIYTYIYIYVYRKRGSNVGNVSGNVSGKFFVMPIFWYVFVTCVMFFACDVQVSMILNMWWLHLYSLPAVEPPHQNPIIFP